ncbi:MAG: SpoIIIAH-like family protein [Lachnospiraceae bacterium]|nr:SpoIIIAH-like family protein [Lachnospiraceae bacterium]
MKNVFKKNQIIITTLALMIVVAGYVSYTNGNLKDKDVAKETSADVMEEEYEISDEELALEGDVFTDIEDDSTETSASAGVETAEVPQGSDTGIENPGEAVLTSSDAANVNFAVEMKLNREQVRSQNKETLLGVINNESLTETQKQAAVDQMIAMTDIAEREAAAEMLLEAKGFTDVVVSITDNSADVVLNMGEVTDAKRAQVEDIVKRKTNVAAENIIITPIQPTEQETENLTEQEAIENTETTEDVESTMSTEAEILED